MELRDLLSIVWKRRIVVAVVFVCCLIGAAAYAFSQPEKRYESGTTIVFEPEGGQNQFLPPESLTSLLSTYAVIAQSEKNQLAATKILGHPPTGTVTTATAPGSWILQIFSEDATPRGAAETVRATTRALFHSIKDNGIVAPTVVNAPVASTTPIETRSPKLILGIAAVIGLVAGLLLALLIENLSGGTEGQAEGASAGVPLPGPPPRNI